MQRAEGAPESDLPEHEAEVEAVLASAFGRSDEGAMVSALREARALVVSLVARTPPDHRDREPWPIVGHIPHYYSRLGFVPASRFGLSYQEPVHEAVFMALELVAGALANVAGVVRYHPELSGHCIDGDERIPPSSPINMQAGTK